MNKSVFFTFLALTSGAFASVTNAAVEYRINGGAWQSIAGGVIDLGSPAQGSDIIVHIADTSPDRTNGLPDEDIGLLRFRAAGVELPARVRILIASASSSLTSANINNPAFSWSPGVRTWTNGLLFEHTPAGGGSPTSYDELREVSHLNANLSRSFIGSYSGLSFAAANIDIGSVIRMRAFGEPDPSEPQPDENAGRIKGYIRGRFNYNPLGAPDSGAWHRPSLRWSVCLGLHAWSGVTR